MDLIARPVIEGEATGAVLRSTTLLSFWGGVDVRTGVITDQESDLLGRAISGTVLVLPGTRGSSSGSSVLLELLANGNAPAAIVLGQIDAIIGIGVVVAKELGIRPIPLLELATDKQIDLHDGDVVCVERSGRISLLVDEIGVSQNP